MNLWHGSTSFLRAVAFSPSFTQAHHLKSYYKSWSLLWKSQSLRYENWMCVFAKAFHWELLLLTCVWLTVTNRLKDRRKKSYTGSWPQTRNRTRHVIAKEQREEKVDESAVITGEWEKKELFEKMIVLSSLRLIMGHWSRRQLCVILA